jgi:predicted MPP superfamily phosphohydrolase
MHLITYIVGVLLLCVLPDVLLWRKAIKTQNKPLKYTLLATNVLFLLSIVGMAIGMYYATHMLPVLIFGTIFFAIYVPKWLYLPFGLFNKHKTGMILAALGFVMVMYGLCIGRTQIETRTITIKSSQVPPSFNGYRIVQLSDLHVGSLLKDEYWIKNLPQYIQSLTPDLIVFTGDLVNTYAEETEGWESIFNAIQAPDGKWACKGNHDYSHYKWRNDIDSTQNAIAVTEAYKKLGWKLLNDSSIVLTKGTDSLYVCGVQNISRPPFHSYGSVSKAMQNIADSSLVIMLSHDPIAWEDSIRQHKNVLLTLSGHTHAMQMGIDCWGIHLSPASIMHPYWDGTYQQDGQYLHVNRGLGYVGFPMRIGMKPEITLIELYSAE